MVPVVAIDILHHDNACMYHVQWRRVVTELKPIMYDAESEGCDLARRA